MPVNMPTSDHAALASLRSDPERAMKTYDFLVDGAIPCPDKTIGGPCTLRCSPLGNNIYKLAVHQGSGDFFFPFVSEGDGGVGMCAVPLNCPDGTLVVTNGMNGCALRVSRSGTQFHFYHDVNGKFMKGKLVPGKVVCQVEYKDYDRMGIGTFISDKWMSDHRRDVARGAGMQWEHYLITVHHAGRWKVVRSSLTTLKTPGSQQHKYQPFTSHIEKLVTSFDGA